MSFVRLQDTSAMGIEFVAWPLLIGASRSQVDISANLGFPCWGNWVGPGWARGVMVYQWCKVYMVYYGVYMVYMVYYGYKGVIGIYIPLFNPLVVYYGIPHFQTQPLMMLAFMCGGLFAHGARFKGNSSILNGGMNRE